MKTKILIIISLVLFLSCKDQRISELAIESFQTNKGENGLSLDIKFLKGKYHNHPTFSFWIEDIEGNYIETLYVTKYLGTGIYGHGSLSKGKWDSKPGPAQRPATLPYWLNKRRVEGKGNSYLPSPSSPVPDAITGATPKGDFILNATVKNRLPKQFRLLMEINQTWDWNEYWNNSKFPDDYDYASSCQPAIVYAVTIDQSIPDAEFFLNPIGHSHYSGATGDLFTDLTTLTTAKEIAYKVIAKVKK